MAEIDGTTKTESNYYFFKSTPSEEAKRYQPTKVDAASVKEETATGETTASVWNKMNTWEERDCTAWAKGRLKELLICPLIPDMETASITISSLKQLEGHASIVFVRGEKRVGYDLSIKAEWEATLSKSGKKVHGEIICEEFADDNDEVDIDVTCSKTDSDHELIVHHIRSHIHLINTTLAEFVRELKAK